MMQLNIILNSHSQFSTVVTDNENEISRRLYDDGRNCSYSKESADMIKPHVSDVLQSVVHKYRVQSIQVETKSNEESVSEFENKFCENLTTYTRYPDNTLPDLRTMHVLEQRVELSNMSDRELCEAVSAHFNSHPTLTGQKNLKIQATEGLKSENNIFLSVYQRDLMEQQFADIQIQEAEIKDGCLECDPHVLDGDVLATINAATIYKIDASLQKHEDGSVSVMGKTTDGGEIKMGSLKDKFLHKNPMNVDRCDAEVALTDFSNGKMKNLTIQVVVNSDEMSGDIIKLNDSMLAGMEQNNGLSQK